MGQHISLVSRNCFLIHFYKSFLTYYTERECSVCADSWTSLAVSRPTETGFSLWPELVDVQFSYLQGCCFTLLACRACWPVCIPLLDLGYCASSFCVGDVFH